MKAIILPHNIFIIFVFTLFSFTNPYTVKRTSDRDFRYEFYTTHKKIKPNKDQMYFWFKGGVIHETQGGIAGDVLNDKFIKMYHSNQIAEQGKFKNGLRVGVWKTWHKNGILATDQNWHNGLRSGLYSRFDTNGNLIEKGRFIANYKTGKWINTENQDTITYKKGKIVTKGQTFTKSEKYKLKQEKKNLDNTKRIQKELNDNVDAVKLASYKTAAKEEKAILISDRKRKNEIKIEAKKQDREQAKNEPKKDSKVKTLFNNLFKKKEKTPK